MNEITLNWIYLRKKDIIVLILSIWSGESVTFFLPTAIECEDW